MKTYSLEESEPAGNRDPLNRRFRIDGKRATQAEFDAIKRDPRVTLNTFETANVNGVVTHYCVARLP